MPQSETLEDRLTRYEKLLETGWLTINECRILTGLPLVEEIENTLLQKSEINSPQ